MLSDARSQLTVRQLRTLPSLSLLNAFRKNPVAMMDNLQRCEGDLVELSLGPKKVVFGFHPDIAECVLKDRAADYHKSRLVFDNIVPLTGPRGLVQLEGDDAKVHRKHTGKSLSQSAIAARFPALVQSIAHGLDQIETAASRGDEIDISTHITKIVLNNAFILTLGHEFATDELADAFCTANKICGASIRSVAPLSLAWPTPQHVRLKNCLAVIDKAIYRLIDRKVRAAPSDDNDLLSLLVRSNFERTQIRDHLVTFLFAGHETTASSLLWTFYLLSQHPEIEQAIRDEAVDFGEQGMTLGHLRRLSKTLYTYQESLRLFPPSWTLAREVIADTQLGPHALRKGSLVFLGVRQIQRHRNFWQRPDEFVPERFAEGAGRYPSSFIPFGGGSRICIGQNIAMIEAVLFLAMTVSKFRFHLRPHFTPEVEALITAHPKNGLPVRVEVLPKECHVRTAS